MKKNLKEMNEHPSVAKLRTEDGDWKDANIIGTELFDDQVVDFLAQDLQHLTGGNNEPDREAKAFVLWLGIDNPIRHSPYVRLVAASERGLWVDGEPQGRMGTPAVLIPWSSIFALHVHTEKILQHGE